MSDRPSWYPAPEHVAELEARAAALAASTRTEHHDDATTYITFRLDTRWYAIAARWVRGVINLRSLTPVPTAPDYFVGVTTVRGEITALVDLRRVLEYDRVGLADRVQVMLLGGETEEFGLMIDRAGSVVELDCDLIDISDALTTRAATLVLGRTADGITVLDAEALLNDDRLYAGLTENDHG